MDSFSNAKNDILSGLSTSIIALPTVIGLGVFIFSPLGHEFASIGSTVGLISAIVLTFTVSIVGKIPAQILSPSTTASFVLADIITELTNLDKYHLNINLDQSHILAWIAIIIIIAAIFQIIFGVLKFGNLIQYIPYPVISGFLNGIGILFVISQWKIFLGLDQKLNYSFEKAINEMSIWNIIIGIITVLALFSAKEWRKKYPKMPPAPIIGISIGVLTYHYLKYIGSYNIGPVIGKLSMSFDNLFPIKIFPKIFTDDAFFTLLPFLLKSGLTLAIVMSISTLLTTLLIGVINENRYSGNRTLKTHGLAHIFSSILGGTVGTSSLSIINIKMGAKTRLSSICCGIFLLIFLIFFQNLIAELPYVVIAGTLVYFGLNIIDLSGIKLLLNALKKREKQNIIITDQSIAILVTIGTLTFGLTTAIGIGTLFAITMYMAKVSKTSTRKYYTGETVHSKVRRLPDESEILRKEGKQIIVFELQGTLFFGSANDLAKQVESLIDQANFFILDFKYAFGADSTGIRTIQCLHSLIEKQNKYLLCCGLEYNGSIYETMKSLGLIKKFGYDRFFLTLDKSLEWAENYILEKVTTRHSDYKVSLSEINILRNFSDEELNIISSYLENRKYKAKDVIFNKGEDNTEMFLLTQGKVKLLNQITAKPLMSRLALFSPGNAFGVTSFVNHLPYINSAIAKTDIEVYVLTRSNYELLQQKHTKIILQLLKNLISNVTRDLQYARDDHSP